MSNEVRSYVSDGVGVVVINRPDRRNALTPEIDLSIRRCAEALANDPEVRAIVITGEGSSFCAGADFSLLSSKAGQAGTSVEIGYVAESQLRYHYLTRLGVPVIAAINGPAYGSGLALALHCDLRVGCTSSKFRLPFADFGLVAELGIPWLLPRLVGSGRTMEWLLSRRVIDAEEALAAGLISMVVAEADFRDVAMRYASEITRGASRSSLATIKRQVWSSWSQSLSESALVGGFETAKAVISSDFKTRLAERSAPKSPAQSQV